MQFGKNFKLFSIILFSIIVGVLIGAKASGLISSVSSGGQLASSTMNEIINRVIGISYNSGTKLMELEGGIKYNKLSINTCDNTSKGAIIFSGTSFLGCNGTSWKSLTGTVASNGGNDTYTKVLLHFDGNITDSSASNVSVTSHNTTNYVSGKFGNCIRFQGSNYLTFPQITDLSVGTEDFTIDFWVKTSAASNYLFENGTSPRNFLQLGTSSMRLSLGYASGIDVNQNYDFSSWTHIAIVRSSGTLMLYINGNRVSSNAYSASLGYVPFLYFGSRVSGSYPFSGYIDEFRFSKGIARRTASTFSVPTSAYN